MPVSSSASPGVGFLLDTNVVSEVSRPRPSERVMTWLAEADEDRLYLSVATIAEIQNGIEAMAAGKKQRELRSWLLDDLIVRFEDRILPVDLAVGLIWGEVIARARKAGCRIEAIDGLLAATAERYGLTLVTRDVADFAGAAVPLLDPWRA